MSAKTTDLYENNYAGLTCKRCGRPTALRSHRKNFVEYLRTRYTGKVPFRCNGCNRRFWLWIDPRDI